MAKPDAPVLAVLFDMDGVLVDSYEVWFALLNATARAFGYAEISRTRFEACWGQGVEEDRRELFPNQSVEELVDFYDAHFMDHVAQLRIAPGVEHTFDVLRARGIPSAVVTNTPNPLATNVVAAAGARPDTVVGGTDVARSKPAPDMIELAATRLGVRTEQSLVVGDSAYDRDAARAAGARFAGIGGISGEIVLAGLEDVLRYV